MHEFAGIRVAGRARADKGAVAQHGDAVGDREDLVHAMADVDDPDAARPQPPHDVEQPRHVGLGQRGRRLVHDEHARVARQRAQDFDPLPIADRKPAHVVVGVEIVDLQRRQQLARACVHGGKVDAAETGLGRMAKKDVFGHRQLGEQQQLLIDRRHAGLARVVGAGEPGLDAVNQNRAAVGLHDAGHDLYQRRLAGSVLAQQRMDLARAHVERHAFQRAHAGIDLAYFAHGDARREVVLHADAVSGCTTTVSTPASLSICNPCSGAPASVMSVWTRESGQTTRLPRI